METGRSTVGKRPTYDELLELAFDAYNQFAYFTFEGDDERLSTGGMSTLESIRDTLRLSEPITRKALWDLWRSMRDDSMRKEHE